MPALELTVMADPHEDEQYDSASDEDFNPDAQAAAGDSSSSEDEGAGRIAGDVKRRGVKRARDQDEPDAELDSGDEATIRELKKRRKRKRKGVKADESEEDEADFLSDQEGGEGGFVRTRAQRRTEKIERRALASTKGATVDVDALWNQLSSIPIGRVPELEAQPTEDDDDYIIIKRTTKFAGQTSTEEKRVLKSSKEAKIWFEEQETAKRKKAKEKENEAPGAPPADEQEPDKTAQVAPSMPLRRPLKRPLKWDPNPTGEVKGLPPSLQLRWPRDKLATAATTTTASDAQLPNHRALPKLPAAAKLNTVQKSKYDWASYVDKNKLAEELDDYGRSKESYAGRTDFLNRLEQKKEEGRLAARSKLAG